MISSIIITWQRAIAWPAGRLIVKEEIVSPWELVKIPKAEWTVRPRMRLAAIPVEAHVINETFLDVRRAVIASIRKDLPVPAFPLTKTVSREPISRVCET